MTHQCNDPKNHCKHCSINGHTEEKCWNLHLELNPNNRKKDSKKKNLLDTYSSKELESSSNPDENIIYSTVQKEVNLSSLLPKEEKEMINSFTSRSKSRRPHNT